MAAVHGYQGFASLLPALYMFIEVETGPVQTPNFSWVEPANTLKYVQDKFGV